MRKSATKQINAIAMTDPNGMSKNSYRRLKKTYNNGLNALPTPKSKLSKRQKRKGIKVTTIIITRNGHDYTVYNKVISLMTGRMSLIHRNRLMEKGRMTMKKKTKEEIIQENNKKV